MREGYRDNVFQGSYTHPHTHTHSCLLLIVKSPLAITDSRPKVTRSPKEAAIGVATLSGLILKWCERRMTMIMTDPSTTLAMAALPMAEAPRSSMWETARSVPRTMEIMVAKPATTNA